MISAFENRTLETMKYRRKNDAQSEEHKSVVPKNLQGIIVPEIVSFVLG